MADDDRQTQHCSIIATVQAKNLTVYRKRTVYPNFDDEKRLLRSCGIEIFQSADVIRKFVVNVSNVDFLQVTK